MGNFNTVVHLFLAGRHLKVKLLLDDGIIDSPCYLQLTDLALHYTDSYQKETWL